MARLFVGGCLVAAATYLHCVTVSVDRHGDLFAVGYLRLRLRFAKPRYQLIATATYLAKPRFAPLGCGSSAAAGAAKLPDFSALLTSINTRPAAARRVFCSGAPC